MHLANLNESLIFIQNICCLIQIKRNINRSIEEKNELLVFLKIKEYFLIVLLRKKMLLFRAKFTLQLLLIIWFETSQKLYLLLYKNTPKQYLKRFIYIFLLIIFGFHYDINIYLVLDG